MLQYQLSNGDWVDTTEEEAARLLDGVLSRESWFAPRQKREPLTTREQVAAFLAKGRREMRHGDEWYENIRAKPAPRPEPKPDLVRCDCGHECERLLVMSASLGSACPDCYDRMSD